MKRTSAIIFDFIFFTYFYGCLIFLINQFFTWNTFIIPGLIITTLSTLIFQFLNDSIGLRITESKTLLMRRFFRTFSGWFIIFLLIITLVVGWIIVEVNISDFLMGMNNTKGILSGLFSPNLKNLLPMLSALAETIYLALLATLFAIPFAFYSVSWLPVT